MAIWQRLGARQREGIGARMPTSAKLHPPLRHSQAQQYYQRTRTSRGCGHPGSYTNRRVALLSFGCYPSSMHTLTIKLKPEQDAWLKKQAIALKRSKGGIVRDLIDQRQ